MADQIERTESTALVEWEFVKLETVEVDAAEWERLAVEPVEAIDAKRGPVLCRCCGKTVSHDDREPIHTFPCISRHARHQRGRGTRRCFEYRGKGAGKGAA